ncbi:MAG: sigma-70 family RNA polymerase sigma factor [Chitinophagaceae bacterium]|nr:sigma-70 family RNA polymerase sigma factor [Chitinophagaceae bacterium]
MLVTKNLSDEVLFDLIRNKDERAIAILLERYKKQFFTYILVIIKDHTTAEDLFQEACIKIINSIRNNKYSEDGRFVQWASRLIRNLCMDYLKSNKRKIMVQLPDGGDIFSVLQIDHRSADHRILQTQFVNRIHYMLDKLPQEQREIIILRFFHKMSFKEIASMLNTNVNTAMGRMRYGIIRLRDMMESMTEKV